MFWWRRTINLWFVPCGVSWVLSWEKAFLRWSLVLWKLRKWSQAGWLKLKRLLEVTLFALNPSWYFFGKYSLYDYILFVRNMLFLSFNSNRVETSLTIIWFSRCWEHYEVTPAHILSYGFFWDSDITVNTENACDDCAFNHFFPRKDNILMLKHHKGFTDTLYTP